MTRDPAHLYFDESPDAIFVIDGAGTVVDVNAAASELTGYARDELVGRHGPELVVDPERGAANVGRLVEDGELLVETEVLRKDGSVVPVECASRRVDEDRYMGVVRDISERREARAALREKEAELRQVRRLESLGQLAGGIAHDFNNLLTAIQGYAHLARQRVPEAGGAARDLDQILEATERATGLTARLLAFARREVSRPVPVRLGEVVGEMGAVLRRVLREDIELRTDLASDLAPVKADPAQLHQVILNLVVNARDAMERGGTVDVSTRSVEVGEDEAGRHPDLAAGEKVVLEVRDDGEGMDEETIDHAFEPFYSTRKDRGGTGLGLSTVYGIVHQTGGWVGIESVPGEGTTVRVLLPPTEEEPVPVREEKAAAQPLGGRETVLLVEDEQPVRDVARRILERAGYRVLEASQADRAIALGRSHRSPVDLLLTDVVMPGRDGKELAEAFREEHPDVRVLFMSGHTDDDLLMRGVREGEVSFLAKPFTSEELLRAVRRTLAGPPG